MKGKYIPIHGKRWKIILGRPPAKNCSGYCCFDKLTIWVSPKKNIRATLIHEVLHAAFPDIEEGVIIEAEKSLESAIQLLENAKR